MLKSLDLYYIIKTNLTIMKKLMIAGALVCAVIATSSCRETETKEVIREVEVEKKVDVNDDDGEGIIERVGKEVDKEVNEEINEEIDKIGNDD